MKDGGLEASYNASSWIISVSPSYNGNTIAYSEGRRVKVLKLRESIQEAKVNVDSQEKSIDHFTILIFAIAIVVASILVVTFKMFRDRGWVRRSDTRGG